MLRRQIAEGVIGIRRRDRAARDGDALHSVPKTIMYILHQGGAIAVRILRRAEAHHAVHVVGRYSVMGAA